jgi:hypothetical protein
MAISISTKKTIYSKDINKVMDTGFNTYINPNITTEITDGILTVNDFFDNYNVLFFEIPLTGSNSHSELIERSSEYVGLDLNLLLQQLNQLQKQNELLQEQINQFNTNL